MTSSEKLNPATPVKALAMLQQFLRMESAGGLLLIGAAVLALVAANVPWTHYAYGQFLNLQLTVTLAGFGVDKPLLLWINDAFMALFFMLVGLELKREVVEGQLSRLDQVMLPGLAAAGGVIVPALIYWWFNRSAGAALNGWAIPTATDIAFALAILGVLGSRVPLSLKVFLTTIAIVDDIVAIIIIAIFYTSSLSAPALLLAGSGIACLFILNRAGVTRLAPYLLIGLFIWFCVLKSGVHATLAGVVVAAFIPLKADDDHSPARQLEHMLHPWVAFAILPLFAFANAGVSFAGLKVTALAGTIPLGIILGLFLGKQVGVLGMVFLARLFKLAELPEGTTWSHVYGVAILCGVGFTMSLFIGSLAFEHGNFDVMSEVKLGVLTGSVISATVGFVVLKYVLPPPGSVTPDGDHQEREETAPRR